MSDPVGDPVKQVINHLQSPAPDISTLLALLASPLDSLGLLPPKFKRYNLDSLPRGAVVSHRHVPLLQRVLLQHVAETWREVLTDEGAIVLLEQYFCPDSFLFASRAAGELTLLAYSTILSLPLTAFSIHLLVRLTKEYPIDRLYAAVFPTDGPATPTKKCFSWEDCVRNVVAVPAKVANSLGGKGEEIPPLLEHATYFNNLSLRCECLVFSLSDRPTKDRVASLTYLLTKLVNLGVFPPTPPTSPSQPSFYQATLPTIRARIQEQIEKDAYSSFWSEIILSLPSSLTLQAILASLFSSLSGSLSGLDPSPQQRTLVMQEATVLRDIIGPLKAEKEELWECVSALLLGRVWSEGYGRIFVCWAAGCEKDSTDIEALGILLDKIVDIWSSPEQIRHSSLARHRYFTALLLTTASYFSLPSSKINSLALSSSFVSGIGTYISHLDNSVKRCGMLVAEVIAQGAGKKLDFGDWEGDDAGKPWARELRQLIKARDVDVDVEAEVEVGPVDGGDDEQLRGEYSKGSQKPELTVPISVDTSQGYDSDDSLTGYASPTSSRTPSPTHSELDEIEKDPTLNVGVKKIQRPVYLAQLGELVRSTSGLQNDASQEADKIEMALDCAETLIRRRSDYGTELEENAVNLVYGFVGLQDNYDLNGFESKRQNAVNALVACCPRKAAPSLIEEFFKNQYSTNQRFVILNALVFGARELASLHLPSAAAQPTAGARTSFPSRLLPAGLHQKYIADGNQGRDAVQRVLNNITTEAIERGKDASVDKVPELVRERRLRISKPAKIAELEHISTANTNVNVVVKPRPSNTMTFTQVAVEFFISPLINRFWLFLRDEQLREERTAHLAPLHQYRGAGTGQILNPLVLAHFLAALAILVNASQNAPEWLALVAPDALELAVTLGTKPVSAEGGGDDDDEIGDMSSSGGLSANDNGGKGKGGKEAAVLSGALELAISVLDGCLEVDGGRTIGLDHTPLVLGVGEWAGTVFSRLEKGVRIAGEGGEQEVRLRRAAAGVLLKVDELTSRWRRSMVDMR